MQRVAFDFSGPALVTFDEDTVSLRSDRHRRRVVLGDVGDIVLGRFDEGDDRLLRPPAGGETGKGKGGAHELKHVPS